MVVFPFISLACRAIKWVLNYIWFYLSKRIWCNILFRNILIIISWLCFGLKFLKGMIRILVFMMSSGTEICSGFLFSDHTPLFWSCDFISFSLISSPISVVLGSVVPKVECIVAWGGNPWQRDSPQSRFLWFPLASGCERQRSMICGMRISQWETRKAEERHFVCWRFLRCGCRVVREGNVE